MIIRMQSAGYGKIALENVAEIPGGLVQVY